ncbi:hypothetical protein, partial [Nocardioides sp.]|uniref:hypothetical protein n=1 Tax=Nocardioides sp. TaxID=35761 RepID=UPI0027373801
EAWAFFVAEDQGPASTAGKRAADFEREGEVLEPVLAALTKAQSAATSGDVEAFGSAADEVRSAVDYIFYLATYKYLDHAGDDVTQAEGETFYLGISETVAAASTEADEEIAGAFASGDAEAGRAALHRPEVLTALGIEESERVDG